MLTLAGLHARGNRLGGGEGFQGRSLETIAGNYESKPAIEK